MRINKDDDPRKLNPQGDKIVSHGIIYPQDGMSGSTEEVGDYNMEPATRKEIELGTDITWPDEFSEHESSF